jgi:hypothetical protein
VEISRKTFYRWFEKDKSFREKVLEQQEGLKDFVEAKIIQQIKEGNTAVMIFYAKTKMKDRGYIERTELDTNITSDYEMERKRIKQILEEMKNGRNTQPDDRKDKPETD